MRPIDADDLVKKIYEHAWGADNIFIDELVDGIIGNMEPVSEQDILKLYLEKLKKQIHAKSFESGLMNPILTYAEIMQMIDELLSEDGEEE